MGSQVACCLGLRICPPPLPPPSPPPRRLLLHTTWASADLDTVSRMAGLLSSQGVPFRPSVPTGETMPRAWLFTLPMLPAVRAAHCQPVCLSAHRLSCRNLPLQSLHELLCLDKACYWTCDHRRQCRTPRWALSSTGWKAIHNKQRRRPFLVSFRPDPRAPAVRRFSR